MLSHSSLKAQTGSSVVNSDEDSLQSFSGNGKFYQIFPLVHGNVIYTDSVLVTGKTNRDSLLFRAKAFFANREDAKYDMQSEEGNGVVIYEGKMKKGFFSGKSDIYFNIYVKCTEDGCQFNLYEIVFASSKPVDNGRVVFGMNGPSTDMGTSGVTLFGGSDTNTDDKAVFLENISFDRGEFSRKFCEKLDRKLLEIMQHLKESLR